MNQPRTSTSSYPPGPASQQQTGVRRIARSLWLRGLLGDASSQPEVETLAARMSEMFLPKGQHLFHEGSAADDIYFIVSGHIRHGERGYVDFKPPDVLGFVDASKQRPHKYEALAQEDSIVLRLAAEDWFEFLEDNFDFFRELMFRRTDSMPLSALNPWDEHAPVFDALVDAHQSFADESATEQLVHCLTALHCSPLLRRASIQALAQLARSAEVLDVGPTLISAEERPLGLWMVGGGRIEATVRHGNNFVQEEVGPGALIGALLPLAKQPEKLEFRGAPRGRVLWIPQELFFDVMEDHFDVGRSVLDYMASQVERLNAHSTDGWYDAEPSRRSESIRSR